MPKQKTAPKMAEEFLARVISHETDRKQVLRVLLEKLHAYEIKYRIRSEIFFKLFAGTPLIKQPDFLDWANCYHEYFRVFLAQFRIDE